MIRLYFYVDGETEQQYAHLCLTPHLAAFGVFVGGPILTASGTKHGRTYRGGGRSYEAMRRDLGRLLALHKGPDVRFTTMFDLYALRGGFPGRAAAEATSHDPYVRVKHLEDEFARDVGDPRLVPHISLYEFETILFADPEVFRYEFDRPDREIAALRKILEPVGERPEFIDDGPTTAPSKRIESVFPGFEDQKVTLGVEPARAIPLATVRAKCPHFHDWLATLEALGSLPTTPES